MLQLRLKTHCYLQKVVFPFAEGIRTGHLAYVKTFDLRSLLKVL